MVEFKAVINDAGSGKSHNVAVSGHHANSLLGKNVGEVVDGIFVGLPGYKLMITGGSDKDGFPMRKDLPGGRRKKLLLSSGVGFNALYPGERRRKAVRGRSVSPDIVQLNMKVTQQGSKPIEEILSSEETE
jgi:small subunit ribosomal protein S6e